MRPVYQETILPNLAYVGGPGEIAYWLQLKSTFNNYNISFPLLLVRDGPAQRAPVVVLGSPDASAQAVATPVSALARQFGGPVIFLMVGEPGADGEGERWEARVAGQLTADGVPVEFRHLPGDGERLHEQLVRIRPGLVAIAGARALEEAATLGLEKLNCTLLLLPS